MTATGHHDDHALVSAARDGSRAAVEALFDRHWATAWRVARGVTGDDAIAEDVVQESFLAALGSLGRLSDGGFRAWLHRITVNRALNEVRRRRPRSDMHGARTVAAPESDDPLDAGFLAAIADLKPDHRAVLVLRYGLDYTPTEIASTLDVAVGTVNSRLARALDALRQTMEPPHVH